MEMGDGMALMIALIRAGRFRMSIRRSGMLGASKGEAGGGRMWEAMRLIVIWVGFACILGISNNCLTGPLISGPPNFALACLLVVISKQLMTFRRC